MRNTREVRSQESDVRIVKRAGFTLLELIVVVGVIGILVAILFPAVNMARVKARERDAVATARALENAITAFKAEYGYWPCPNPDIGGTFSSAAQQSDIINRYLLMNGAANTRNVAFWETGGCVTNYSATPPRPFSISISITNNTVTVQ